MTRSGRPAPLQAEIIAPDRIMKITREQAEAWRKTTAEGPFNRWLDPQVRGPEGRLDLVRLHTVAREYGVDKEAAYAHLNPGQQRMSVGILLRRRVPAELWSSDLGQASSAAEPRASLATVAPERPAAIRDASARELLETYAQIMDELRGRGIVRTANGPGGDYAELLFALAFGWKLENNSAAGHDGIDREGVRYQIKSRRLRGARGSRQLSAIRNLPAGNFEHLAVVLFDGSYGVLRAVILPHATVLSRARFRSHTNSWKFIADDAALASDGARDVTAELREAAAIV